MHEKTCASATQEVVGETACNALRLIVAHDPCVAAEATVKRELQIQTLESQAAAWVGKLDAQDGGQKKRGRKLSDGRARARFYREVSDLHLTRIVRVDLHSEWFTYDISERALAHARLMDGQLLLVTHTAVTALAPAEAVKRDKSLADNERGFRALKPEIEIGSIDHRRRPQRIRAHAAICFIALILYRVMRTRLHASSTGLSPERALDKLRRIQQNQTLTRLAGELGGKVMVRGLQRVDQLFVLTMTAYNLTRMRTPGKIRLQAA